MSSQRTWTVAEQQAMAREVAGGRPASCPIDGAKVEVTTDKKPSGTLIFLICRACGNDAVVEMEE